MSGEARKRWKDAQILDVKTKDIRLQARKLCITLETFALLLLNLCYNEMRFLVDIEFFALKTEIFAAESGKNRPSGQAGNVRPSTRPEVMRNPMKNMTLSGAGFSGIRPFEKKLWLSSPTMHGEERKWVDEAIRTNWVSTVGENIDEIERMTAEKTGRPYAVALSSGTAALHLAVRLCGEKLYGQPRAGHGTLEGRRVFCSDVTFDASDQPCRL